MSQLDIEVILTQQLASYLTLPIFLVDPAGSLVFYNEPAEAILGQRFAETGDMAASEWGTAFQPTREDGSPLPVEELPLVQALESRCPTQGKLWIVGLDGERRRIQVTAIPLVGLGGKLVGAAAIFVESSKP